ncbi:undecaprenyl phosphate-alpha-4-amino-4-deoxy-L-arabinose arabinosyl transferase [Geobacter sp. OR-1]|uniref:ArnT family glycosyltransferase n=1 Tax=Geobacter sp. OR-1 TaxID=1266765 RepID=UPI000543580D|nr:glycosyltransferase family 39 protein [Geobacter sp. OR-1]GAM10541.1 undecaprenyl phosphate-alpha-4-amino-4-deoxy-L-arabinose arabinosyl transferase [Geobacter sp. OR-1]
MKREAIILFLIIGFSFALRMAFLHEPLQRDEGHYAYIGQEILRGNVPYRDAIEIKPPGAFYIYAAGMAVFGETAVAIRMFTALYAMFTVLAVYLTTRQVWGNKAGLWAAFICGLTSSGPLVEGSSSNTEVFMVLPMTAGIYFFLRNAATGRPVYLAASGMAAGLAMVIKPVALPQVLILFAFLFFLPKSRGSMKGMLVNVGSFILPIVVLAAVTLGYFASKGALDDLLWWTIKFPFNYRDSGIYGPPIGKAFERIAPEFALPLAASLPTAVWIVLKRPGYKELLMMVLTLGAVAGVYLPGKFFPHYFIILIPQLAILAGGGIASVFAMDNVRHPAVVVLIIAVLSYSIMKEYRFYLFYPPEKISELKFGKQFVEAVELAEYIKNRTVPADYLFQWGLEPELYFLSTRRSPTRYIASVLPAWSEHPQRAVLEVLTAIQQKRPKYLVYQPDWADWEGQEEIEYVIDHDYVLEEQMADCYVYRRKDGM